MDLSTADTIDPFEHPHAGSLDCRHNRSFRTSSCWMCDLPPQRKGSNAARRRIQLGDILEIITSLEWKIAGLESELRSLKS
jgi:hypothetical protein